MMQYKAILLVAILFVLSVSLAAVTQEYVGYLSDNTCGIAGTDAVGNQILVTPEKHTLDCMKSKNSNESGYGMVVPVASKEFVFFKFDRKGSQLAKKSIVDKTRSNSNIMIRTRGTVDEKVRMMTVESISQYFPPQDVTKSSVIPLPTKN